MEPMKAHAVEKGRVCRLQCRNLQLGVYDGRGGFIGIRIKFDNEYLDVEYFDCGDDSFNTVRGYEPTEIVLPEEIGTWVYADVSIDGQTGKAVRYDEAAKWWRFNDGTLATEEVVPTAVSNWGLFHFLKDLQERLYREENRRTDS